ncbi:hemoglobin [Hyphomicrobium sp. 1Nfss2.1]|uniref:group III truncated hemoglobin n=1 Tax=Hyphomicrobium sp. 1Nfss2.1 TaxID=3413936 RepID=UPI003C7D4D03
MSDTGRDEAATAGAQETLANVGSLDVASMEAAIERCVRLFYDRAHADELLAPVMRAGIVDFERHVAVVCDFWSRALLGTERYQGKAYPAHVGLPIRPEHFDRWLELFEEAAAIELPPAQAKFAIDKAHHMAKSFMAGLFPLETPRMKAHRARLVFEWPQTQTDPSRRS